MRILFSTTSRAAIITATGDTEDQHVVAAIPAELETANSPVRDQVVALREAIASLAAAASAVVATYTPAARVDQLRKLAVRTLADLLQRLIAAGRAECRAIVAAWARLIAVPTADAATAMLRSQDRTTFAPLPIGDKAAWIARADVEQLGALIEGGKDRAGVTDQLWSIAERRYAALNFIRIAGTASDYARKPSVDDPLATGVDMVAAERGADEGLARHDQRSEIVEAVDQTVQGIVSVVALMCNLDRASAFKMLTTSEVPQ